VTSVTPTNRTVVWSGSVIAVLPPAVASEAATASVPPARPLMKTERSARASRGSGDHHRVAGAREEGLARGVRAPAHGVVGDLDGAAGDVVAGKHHGRCRCAIGRHDCRLPDRVHRAAVAQGRVAAERRHRHERILPVAGAEIGATAADPDEIGYRSRPHCCRRSGEAGLAGQAHPAGECQLAGTYGRRHVR
jgi:hypothetical protein